ncbi:MAG: type II toxin-antitoxin system Phd/YefM family antitoxin [Thermodesulfobacteriota bacterium]|nr:type II toxin-antitoxin system Phd/YefM family antitoxin [Thermodesulfobacteriota bacterium]
MKRQFSIAEAKNKLPSIIHQVEKGPSVKLTRRGEPVAVLLSIHEYELMGQKSKGFWNALMTFRQVVQDETLQIADSDFEGLRDPDGGREVQWEG